MGVVVEPSWVAPGKVPWDYTIFGSEAKVREPDHRFEMTFKKIPGERVTLNRWTINGKSYPDTDPLLVEGGKRYRLVFHNETGDSHPPPLASPQLRTQRLDRRPRP